MKRETLLGFLDGGTDGICVQLKGDPEPFEDLRLVEAGEDAVVFVSVLGPHLEGSRRLISYDAIAAVWR